MNALLHKLFGPFAPAGRALGRFFRRLLDQRTVSHILKFLVRFAAALTCFVLVFLVGYILFYPPACLPGSIPAKTCP